MMRRQTIASIVITFVALTSVAPAAAATCDSLASLTLLDTAIATAELVPAGPFTPPGATRAFDVPRFCRIVAMTAPAVRFEVWLPTGGWNGKFHVSGNGGMAGTISYAAMGGALRRGYAAAGTDTGHVRPGTDGFDASWAIGRPELVEDFGHRSLHVTTEHGKTLTGAFYGGAPRYSYYVGCSKGGQQGLMEAQRYPGDFDGIVAGDPANDWTRFYAGAHLWYSLATLRDPGSWIPPDKVQLLGDAVTAACDRLDGIEDGVIDDPRTCTFDPGTLACGPGQDPGTCFTAQQVQAVTDIWAGSRTPSGDVIFPGLVPGGEAGPGGWSRWVTGDAPFTSLHWLAAAGFFKYMVFEEPDWNFRTFDYDEDLALALDKVGPALDSDSPDLRPFRDAGGKLIVYHGWSDSDISPLGAINYYESVLDELGGKTGADQALAATRAFYRLFMVPGMGHCSGGPGPNRFDALSALEQWVEQDVPPTRIIASRVEQGEVVRTRPLCPYPEVAEWKGAGSTDIAANFSCVAPRD
jgi:feruloyl esterase